jgi:anti-sigma B factor antagonist
MELNTQTIDNITIVTITGELDAATSPVAQQQILPLATAGSRILLDLSGVPYMSSAGLRMLLSTYRQLSSSGGRIVLVGVAEEIQDTMSVTGFINFFTIYSTAEEGIAALQE